ncbi:hypothetical protein BDW66DRAFT_150062 [Aspergillus desertorum]
MVYRTDINHTQRYRPSPMDRILPPDKLSSPITIVNKALLPDDERVLSYKTGTSPAIEDHRPLLSEERRFLGSENIANRLTRLARLSTLKGSHTNPISPEARSINQCLDTLESLLSPRSNLQANLAHKVAPNQQSRNRPGRGSRFDPGPDPDAPRRPDPLRTPAPSSCQKIHTPSRTLEELSTMQLMQPARTRLETPKLYNQVNEFGEEVRKLGDAFLKRREETLYIYSLHDRERKRMRRKIAELEAEIEELQADMQQDMAEREALQGTVRGFETWIKGCQEEYQLAHKKSKETTTQNGRGWWSKKKVNQPDDFDANALFDGITGWMRGWADVEEEFRDRDRARRQRTTGKNKQEQETTTIDRRSSAID